MNDERNAAALVLAREWQQAIAALASDTTECLEMVTELTLKTELKGHPYFWGKMSILRTLRELADADVKRFETPGAAKIVRDLERARVIVSVASDLAAWYRHLLRYASPEEYDQALARLEAFESMTRASLT
jgi:hypothetical protein